ncbi:MAG: hypothetical protein ACRDIU_11530 [Actinomycetota bacterium]
MLTQIHRIIGYAAAGLFLAIALMGMYYWIRNRHPGGGFWKLLAVAQGSLAVQILWGIPLFFFRGGQHWLHYVYGGFPVVALIFAHRFSRKLEGLEWAAFAVASFFIFGLQVRGMMTAG